MPLAWDEILISANIQLLTFIKNNMRICRPRYMIFTETEVEVSIIYLGTMDPYTNRNESQSLFYYMKLLFMSSDSCFIDWH